MGRDGDSRTLRALGWLAAWTAACLLAVLAACGGGVGAGGTGAFASGPITGFGSIIVEGTHFDDSSARVEGDDGAMRDRGELRLGTMVEIDSGEIRDGAATATRVRIVSALIGRVDAVAVDMLLVNGLTVRVNSGTVFDDRLVGGIAAITAGAVVEVYGYVSASEIVATRIEPDDGATQFKFCGVMSALDTQARTFDIGTQHFAYAAGVGGAGQLRNGAFVHVEVGVVRDAQGRWVVSAVGNTGPGGGDRDQAKARGVITSFTSVGNFAIGGVVVDASAAQIDGGPLAAGQQVEVEGRLVAGVLLADSVKVEDQDQPDALELRGAIATLDAQVFTLVGRSERIGYTDPGVVFEKGFATDLAPGRHVRVLGQLSADGTQVDATRIRFDD